jgi:hypothetical protein
LRELTSANVLKELWVEDKAKVTPAFTALVSVNNVEGAVDTIKIESYYNTSFLSVGEVLGNEQMLLLVKVPKADWEAKIAELEAHNAQEVEMPIEAKEGNE